MLRTLSLKERMWKNNVNLGSDPLSLPSCCHFHLCGVNVKWCQIRILHPCQWQHFTPSLCVKCGWFHKVQGSRHSDSWYLRFLEREWITQVNLQAIIIISSTIVFTILILILWLSLFFDRLFTISVLNLDFSLMVLSLLSTWEVCLNQTMYSVKVSRVFKSGEYFPTDCGMVYT